MRVLSDHAVSLSAACRLVIFFLLYCDKGFNYSIPRNYKMVVVVVLKTLKCIMVVSEGGLELLLLQV